MSLKDLSQKAVLDVLDNPQKRKDIEELGNFGKRICLNGSIYHPFLDNSSVVDTWKQVDIIKKKMAELNHLKEDYSPEQMELYGLNPLESTKEIKVSGQVLNDFLSLFENLTGFQYPRELAYYLSLSNDVIVIKYSLSLLNQIGKSLEECLVKGIITQELYDQVIKRQETEKNNPLAEFQGVYVYLQGSTRLAIGKPLEYFPNNSVLMGLGRNCGMGWTIRLSCFLDKKEIKEIEGKAKWWFVHMYDGSNDQESYYNYDKLKHLEKNQDGLQLMTFEEGLALINQDRYPEDFMHEDGILWL
jgi:hypothetical protein